MKAIMTTTNLKTIDTLEVFIDGTQLAAFAVLGSKTERYILSVKLWLNAAHHVMFSSSYFYSHGCMACSQCRSN